MGESVGRAGNRVGGKADVVSGTVVGAGRLVGRARAIVDVAMGGTTEVDVGAAHAAVRTRIRERRITTFFIVASQSELTAT